MNNVLEINPNAAPVPIVAATPLDLLNRAAAAGAEPEVLAQWMALYERWDERQAKKAFDRAIALARAEIPTIIKNRAVDFTSQKGRTNYRYEDLASIEKAAVPVLSKYGLQYRFRTEALPKDQTVIVTCRISHEAGYAEENSLPGPYDTSGNKNVIQGLGSTVTYLQRYTLKASLGLAASNDDDGQASGNVGNVALIAPEQIADLRKLMAEVGADEAKFLSYMGLETLEGMPMAKYGAAIVMLEKKRSSAGHGEAGPGAARRGKEFLEGR